MLIFQVNCKYKTFLREINMFQIPRENILLRNFIPVVFSKQAHIYVFKECTVIYIK